MKRPNAEQVQNIVFLVLVVAAALGIYWFSSRPANDAVLSLPTPAPSDSPAPSLAPTPGVAEDAFLSALADRGLTCSAAGERYLVAAKDSPVALTLTLTRTGKTVQGFTLELPVTLPAEAKSGSAIERALAERYAAAHTAECEAIRAALTACGESFQGSPAIPYGTLVFWYDGAAETLLSGKTFEDASDGVRFTANRVTVGDRTTLACSVFAGSR